VVALHLVGQKPRNHLARRVLGPLRHGVPAGHAPLRALLHEVEPAEVVGVRAVRDPRALAHVEQHLALRVGADRGAHEAVAEVALLEVVEQRQLRLGLRRDEADQHPPLGSGGSGGGEEGGQRERGDQQR
jgi:hypothetical protein